MKIRPVKAEEYAAVGRLVAGAYAGLPGMPGPEVQPEYYAMLHDVGRRAGNPAITVFVAVDEAGELLGSVDFISDMKQYGSGGTAGTVADGAGIRLLAVAPAARRGGVGKALTLFCVEQARELGKGRVVLHTTRAMETAWGMYERLGFRRFPEVDFRQGALEVFGFQLPLR